MSEAAGSRVGEKMLRGCLEDGGRAREPERRQPLEAAKGRTQLLPQSLREEPAFQASDL